VLRLMRQHGVLVKGNPRLKALRTPSRSKPRPTTPNHWWGIDMTKVMVEPLGWVNVVIVLDWYAEKIVGHYAGSRPRRPTGLSHWIMRCSASFLRGAGTTDSIS
jgi:hypothetical protein